MGSTVRHGFSTLNRLLGKKNKDSSLNKSNTNLSALDTSSQHNKIIPLAASTNAPFEQTFRITICLPRDQLFVVRVGAKTKLAQLLDTVCANKQLDAGKFEFRHPDGSQTYDLAMTIGEVGLNEIRLADKTDKTYIKFNTDDIMRLRHLSRESLTSSSDFSKGSARQYSKTVSPYSSTNSLNSMDSATGLNQRNHNNNLHNNRQSTNGGGGGGDSGSTTLLVPVAPQRKKRVAPRPPSQLMGASTVDLSTSSAASTSVSQTTIGDDSSVFKKPALVPAALPRKSFHVSTPNLNGQPGNTKEYYTPALSVIGSNGSSEQHLHGGHTSNAELNRRSEPAGDTPTLGQRPTIAGSTPHLSQRSRTSSDCSEIVRDGEQMPTPRKRTFISAAKKKAAPAPPPRLIINSVEATTTIIEEVPTTPTVITPPSPPNTANISKVMLNVDTTTAIVSNVIELDSRDLPSLSPTTTTASSSTADEPQSLDCSTGKAQCSVSSSDEDETKIYNIQSGKPIISVVTSPPSTPASPTPPITSHPIQVISTTTITPVETVMTTVPSPASPNHKSLTILRESSEPPTPRAESPLWTYPLPAPMNFADPSIASSSPAAPLSIVSSSSMERHTDISDAPIKPVITERRPLDFQAFSDHTSTTVADDDDEADRATLTSDAEDGYQGYSQKFSREALLESLDRRRDLFIENEFQFLTNEADSDSVTETKGATTASALTDVDSNGNSIRTIANPVEMVASIGKQQADVMAELKDVMQNDRVDMLIGNNNNVDEQNDTIFGCEPSGLSNFKIHAYDQSGDDIPSEPTNGQVLSEDPDETETAADPSTTTHFTPSKRGSITSGTAFKTPTSRINRSDSFHSTRPIATSSVTIQAVSAATPLNGLTPRSSSYISLIGTQKFENRSFRTLHAADAATAYRRSSSSELSIADAPSLQSLSVMKSILSNSRKNSVSNDHNSNIVASSPLMVEQVLPETADADSQLETDAVTHVAPAAEVTTVSAPLAAVVSTPATKTNVTITQLNGSSTGGSDATAAAEKKWRYQGPPSINMSTWGERPKSTISIKTDKDYKFGGLTAGQNDSPKSTMPRVEDVSVKTVDVNGSAAVLTVKTTGATAAIDSDRVPIIRGVVPKVSTTFIGGRDSGVTAGNLNIRRPSYEISTYVAEKPNAADTIVTSTMTLGRVSIPHRWSQSHALDTSQQTASAAPAAAAVTVKTFKVADPVSSAAAQLLNNGTIHMKTNYAIAKDGSFDSGYKSMPPVYSEYNAKLSAATKSQEEEAQQAAPFSQFTLRKTGLKDKILADSTARNITTAPNSNGAQTTTVHLRSGAEGGSRSRPFSVPAFVVNNSASTTGPLPKKAVAVVSTSAVTAAAPAPPPPPAVVQLRNGLSAVGSTQRKTLPAPVAEPRDQLLDAIRNFSKGSLNKK